MTGFGRAEKKCFGETITVEIRSVNSKSIDLNTRIPYIYKDKELEIKNLVSKKLVRGKIDVFINTEKLCDNKTSVIHTDLVKNYMDTLRNIAKAEEIEYLKMAIRMPNSLKAETEYHEKTEFPDILTLVDEAIQDLLAFRKQEGMAMEKDLILRIHNIRSFLLAVCEFDSCRIQNIRNKFAKNFNELNVKADGNRLEQELIYYIEKLDVTEEKLRLHTHLDFFLETLNTPESGRKLGFICQEIGREINTIGSKSNHAEMQKLVVEMKDELEKIKEQILNVL